MRGGIINQNNYVFPLLMYANIIVGIHQKWQCIHNNNRGKQIIVLGNLNDQKC